MINRYLNCSWRTICLLVLMLCSSSYAHEAKQDSTISQTAQPNLEGQLSVSKLADGVYLHHSYMNVSNFGLVEANGLIVVQDKQAFIIDTPWTDSDTAKLIDWITLKGFTPVASISTHSHQDRAGGIGYLNSQDISTTVSETTQQILAKNDQPIAKNTFAEKQYIMQTDLVEVYNLGAGHTLDNLVVWLPTQQILFGGCLIKSLNATTLGYTGEADMQAWPLTVAKVQAQFPQVKMVVPGHGEIGDKSLLNHTIALLNPKFELN
ncbi:DIM/SIM/IMP family subclass B1 metallo-beta-lactamase [Shewanella sp. CAL98-MNA-CIBAN-0140]|uniref:DIM/SIM/IMP family subclass B1 metallo-beta-lactamase n=1 Tax=Shewanella sp. CAL98-MNA-CIBAN-0140 TaxID=3140462 RepID=UPI003327CA1D